MSIKKWKAKFELFFDATNIVTINVEANTEYKAKLKAFEKAKKIYNCNCLVLRSINQIA